ncbi:MAG: dienelactone hydrolase family protein [Actinomycetota bacterium]
MQEANELFGALSSADVDARMFVYEGAGHWFANESVPDAYDKAAAELAFERSADFLRHHLA